MITFWHGRNWTWVSLLIWYHRSKADIMNQLMMNFRGSDICHQNLDIKKTMTKRKENKRNNCSKCMNWKKKSVKKTRHIYCILIYIVYVLACLNRLSWLRKRPKQFFQEIIYGRKKLTTTTQDIYLEIKIEVGKFQIE